MKLRGMFVALMVALLATVAFTPAAFAKKDAKLLKNAPVSGTLADGGSFRGTVTITSFGYNAQDGLVASGVLQGTATQADGSTTEVKQAFTDADAGLTSGTKGAAGVSGFAATQQLGSCQILFLDLGPIFLDVLGLQVDLSRIVLDITAQSGAGNLLGNLLCAVAGLLDPGGFLTDLINGLTTLTGLLAQINQLLSRL